MHQRRVPLPAASYIQPLYQPNPQLDSTIAGPSELGATLDGFVPGHVELLGGIRKFYPSLLEFLDQPKIH